MSSDPNSTAWFGSDLDLVRRAQQGESDAFASLFYGHKARVYSICLRMTNNTADAEDLTQDAFLQVFRKLSTFRGDSALSTWLYRIAVNAIYDHLRRCRRPGVVSIEEIGSGLDSAMRDGSTSLGEQVENADLARKLLAGLGLLTRQERIVFVLRDLQEMDTDAIGRVLRLSQVTVRRHCMSARQKLRNRLFVPRT